MKFLSFIVLISIFIILNPSIAPAQQESPPLQHTAAIAFYNLENLFDTIDDPKHEDEDFTPLGSYRYTTEIYQKKLKNMAFALSQLAMEHNPEGPVLIGLAEVENETVLKDLIAQTALKDRHLKYIHFESPDRRGIDVALLYHPTYFKLISARAIAVYLVDSLHKETTRDILYVKGKLGLDTIHVFVNHWPSRRTGKDDSYWKRALAAKECRKAIDDLFLKDQDARIIVMGDFNDDPTDNSLTKILKATDQKEISDTGTLFNPWAHFYKQGLGTLHFKNSWNLFDQIIISSGLLKQQKGHWQYTGAEIFNRTFLKVPFGKQKGNPQRSFQGTRWLDGYSDHFPAVIYVTKTLN